MKRIHVWCGVIERLLAGEPVSENEIVEEITETLAAVCLAARVHGEASIEIALLAKVDASGFGVEEGVSA